MAKHGKHARVQEADAELVDGASVQAAPEYDALENNAPEATKGISVHQKKSKRMRTVLIVVSAVLVVLIAALGYFAFMLYQEASDVASQASSSTAATLKDTAEATDAKKQGSRLTAPNLVALLGSTEDEAISKVGRGATVASSSDITEEKGEGDSKTTEVVGKTVTLALTEQQADSKGNTPSVYLTLDKDGKITQAGYSAAMSTLGYGDVSFSDAVTEKHVVETLLGDAGLTVEDGSVELPSADEYRTYANDGKTIAQEQYTFSGEAPAALDGAQHAWQCRLNSDYSAANVSNNLSDTLRLFYVYVNA